jgi:hypothetical protein
MDRVDDEDDEDGQELEEDDAQFADIEEVETVSGEASSSVWDRVQVRLLGEAKDKGKRGSKIAPEAQKEAWRQAWESSPILQQLFVSPEQASLFDRPISQHACKEILQTAAVDAAPFARTLPPTPGWVLERYVSKEEHKALRTEIAHNEAFYPQAQAMVVVQFELTRKVETMFERLAPLYASHPLLYQEAESMLQSMAVALQIAIGNLAQIADMNRKLYVKMLPPHLQKDPRLLTERYGPTFDPDGILSFFEIVAASAELESNLLEAGLISPHKRKTGPNQAPGTKKTKKTQHSAKGGAGRGAGNASRGGKQGFRGGHGTGADKAAKVGPGLRESG